MSTATLNIRWNDFASNLGLPILHGAGNSFTRSGARTHERHCPSCDSIVYSRRHRLCGGCGQELPEYCLFTATEAETVKMLLRTERERHKAWMKKSTAI